MDLFLNIISHPAFGIVYGLVGFLIGNYFALFRDRRKESISDLKNFRSIIAKEISGFNNKSSIFRPGDKGRLDDIYASILVFKPSLSRNKQKVLLKLWDEYKKHEELYLASLYNEIIKNKCLYLLNKLMNISK